MEDQKKQVLEAMSRILDSDSHKSPYMIQIGISFWMLFCEVFTTQKYVGEDELSGYLEKYEINFKIEKILYSNIG